MKALSGVKSVSYVRSHGDNANEFVVDPVVGYDIRKPLFELMRDKDWAVLQLRSNQMSLEDIFLRLTDDTTDTAVLERSLKRRKEQNEQEATQK